ncbi:MAG: histone deacetylase [bacterium]|nr:histone deacetylase [bacterium]
MNRLRIYQDLRFREHPAGEIHIESPKRLRAVAEAFDKSDVLCDAEFSDGILCESAQMELAHAPEYIAHLKRWCDLSEFIPSAEIELSPKSWVAIQAAAGSCIDAVQSALDGDIDCAFVAPRPPGHHAEYRRPLGFCMINNIAIAASYALKNGVGKVAILDFDLHHGNGTQNIFWNNPNALFMSFHQDRLFPLTTGTTQEQGGLDALGMTINLPLQPGVGDEILPGMFEDVINPAIKNYQPEMIFLSAGFDGHKDDILGNLQFTEDGFRWITQQALKWASDLKCPIVSVLEGGYTLESLASSALVHCETLLLGK